MKAIPAVVIGFVHDFATGCWAASVAAIWYLDRREVGSEAAVILGDLERWFFVAGVVCVTLVLATGAGRTFTYVPNVYGEDQEVSRRRLLIAKHVVLLVVFGAGLYWQYVTAFR